MKPSRTPSRCTRVVVRQASCFWYHHRTITHHKQEKTYG